MTKLEYTLIENLADRLDSWIGSENYSDCDCKELASLLGWELDTVKGVIGSLVKKGILVMWENENGFPPDILFKDQDLIESFVTCPDCGDILIQYQAEMDSPDLICPHCGASGEVCEFPDLY